jgi:NADH-ubiquinone oxidoreductase chain 6
MYTFVESISNGYSIEILDLLSIFSLCAGIAVITTKNPIESLLGLIFLFAMIAIYLILCGFNFIGFSYLIVYIGAVSILFLFILMLINIRSSELQSNNLNSIALGLFIVLLINYILFEELPYSIAVLNNFIHKLYTIGSTMFIGTEYPIPEYLLNFLLKNQAV